MSLLADEAFCSPLASAIVSTLNSVHGTDAISYPTSAFVTHLVYLHDTEVLVDKQRITVCDSHGRTRCPNRTDLGADYGGEVRWGERVAGETVWFRVRAGRIEEYSRRSGVKEANRIKWRDHPGVCMYIVYKPS